MTPSAITSWPRPSVPRIAAQALEHLDQALALQADYLPARAARGSLYYQMGKPESALTDLEFVAARQPDDSI